MRCAKKGRCTLNESPKVVDASLAVKWFADEEDSQKARALSRGWADSGIQIAAPHLMLAEVSNALHRKVVGGEIALESATGILENLGAHEIEFHNPPNIHAGALQIADRLDQGAVYDSIYLALAERLDCELWTADRRFYRAARRFSDKIRWLGDFIVAP